MPNTSELKLYSSWINQQEAFISSLQLQPLVVVLRPTQKDFEKPYSRNPFFSIFEELSFEGVRHIEIGWSSHPDWASLIKELKSSFTNISLGAASITSTTGLKVISELNMEYAMTPIWNPKLQLQARNFNQLLIPGVFSPTEIQQAQLFGCRLIKLFPASTLGIKYLSNLKQPLGKLPFIIASGGLSVDDIIPWLEEGYGAIALGRRLLQNDQINSKLKSWLKRHA